MKHIAILWWELTHTPALILVLTAWLTMVVGLLVEYVDWLWDYRSPE